MGRSSPVLLRGARHCRLSVALAVLTLVVGAAVARGSAPARGRRLMYIQRLGRELPEADVALVRSALVRFYGLDVQLLPRVELPSAAYYPSRRRYRAERLLTWLEQRLPADGDRILGLTGVDISTSKRRFADWGVLGLATIEGRVAVISAFRCRLRAYGAEHARVRLAKIAVHEIGHTLGLEHCPVRGCLMEDARGRVTTTDRETDLCRRCRAQLARAGRVIPAAAPLLWSLPPASTRREDRVR